MKQHCKSQLRCPPVYFRYSTHAQFPSPSTTINFNYHGETLHRQQRVSHLLVMRLPQQQKCRNASIKGKSICRVFQCTTKNRLGKSPRLNSCLNFSLIFLNNTPKDHACFLAFSLSDALVQPQLTNRENSCAPCARAKDLHSAPGSQQSSLTAPQSSSHPSS